MKIKLKMECGDPECEHNGVHENEFEVEELIRAIHMVKDWAFLQAQTIETMSMGVNPYHRTVMALLFAMEYTAKIRNPITFGRKLDDEIIKVDNFWRARDHKNENYAVPGQTVDDIVEIIRNDLAKIKKDAEEPADPPDEFATAFNKMMKKHFLS